MPLYVAGLVAAFHLLPQLEPLFLLSFHLGLNKLVASMGRPDVTPGAGFGLNLSWASFQQNALLCFYLVSMF